MSLEQEHYWYLYVSPALLSGHLLALLSRHLLALLLRLLAAHLPLHLLTGSLGHLLALGARHLSAHIAGHGLTNLPAPAAARGLGHFSATSGDLQLLSSSGSVFLLRDHGQIIFQSKFIDRTASDILTL